MSKKDSNKFVAVDDVIDDFLVELTEFHGIISTFAIKNSDPQLELAIQRIAEALTALNKRSQQRHKEGTHGKEK